jgi:hypothetical protein
MIDPFDDDRLSRFGSHKGRVQRLDLVLLDHRANGELLTPAGSSFTNWRALVTSANPRAVPSVPVIAKGPGQWSASRWIACS